VASCPACGRSVALARALCFYCGAPLAAERGGASFGAAETAREAAPGRMLVLVDLARSEPGTLAQALGISSYDAGLLSRRGGLHLLKAAPEAAAAAEADRLRALRAKALLVPESEVRARPVACRAGELRSGGLWLRSAHGPLTLARGDVLLVVSGPITRERQAIDEPRRIMTARLEEGFRIHLHRRSASPPLEIDALNFELGFAVSGSVRLELEAWLAACFGGARRDTGFARLPAVLGASEPEPAGGALAAADALAGASRRDDKGRPLLLDNLAQFRLYSGCLGAVARRL
jgi:hypothetical protein